MILDRRALLRLAGVATALPWVPIAPARALGATRFAPPAGEMRYTRRLERGLADGASLVVSRSFAVRFVPETDGFRVDGSQVAVAVDAPAHSTVTLVYTFDKAGTTIVGCHVPGHYAAGMRGTITILPR